MKHYWKEYFKDKTLEDAEMMFSRGKVKRPEWNEDGELILTVRDDRNYTTILDIDPDSLICSLHCDCSKALRGAACVHMAASLLFFEDMTEEMPFIDFSVLLKSERDAMPRFEVIPKDNTDIDEKVENGDASSSDAPTIPVVRGEILDEVNRLRTENRNKRKVDPVYASDRSGEEYRFFYPEKFDRNIKVDKRYIDAAEKILSGKYELSVSTGFLNERYGQSDMIGWGNIKGVEPGSYYQSWSAVVSFGRDSIISCSCKSAGCYDRDYYNRTVEGIVCGHTIACIKAVKKYLTQNNIGDTTNVSGMRLMNRMEENALANIGETVRDIHIEPVINIPVSDREQMTLTFKAGTDKLYVIKDLSAFVSAVSDKNEYSFGKNSVVRLGKERLSGESMCWYEYIEKKNRELKKGLHMRAGYGYGGWRGYNYAIESSYNLGKEIIIDDNEVDDLFDIANGKIIACKRQGKNSGFLNFCEKPLPLRLRIEKDTDPYDNTFCGIDIIGKTPSTFSGKEHSYYIKDDNFVRVFSEDEKMLNDLLREESGGMIDIRIGRLHLRSFYADTLPALRRIAEIEEPYAEEIASYIPPSPEFVFYLDVDNGSVILRVDVCYGAESFSLVDFLQLSNGKEVEFSGIRDKFSEEKVTKCVAQYFTGYDARNDIIFSEKEDDLVFRLLDHGIDEFMSYGEVYSTDRFKRLSIKRHVKFDMGVSFESDLLDLEITSDELSPQDLMAILKGYRSKQVFVKLKNGDLVKLDEDENVSALSDMLDGMGVKLEDFVKGKMHIPAYRALYLDRMMERLEGVYTERDKRFKQLIRDFESVDNADYEVPKQLKTVLRNYQKVGFRWLRTLDGFGFGGILADDMGLGKTLQVITVLRSVIEDNIHDNKNAGSNETEVTEILKNVAVPEKLCSLIVCPASLVYNWGEEFSRFAPDLKVGLVLGTQEERARIIEDQDDYDVLVTSYDLLKRDIEKYSGHCFRFEVIDEAQYIKNHNTEAARSVKLINAGTRFALTGTPIENRLSELWSIFDYLMPGMLFSYQEFKSRFETKIVKYSDQSASEQLKRMVQPFILRRLKGDVLKDLPDKLEETRYAGMDREQRRLYDAQVVKMRKDIEAKDDSEFSVSKIEILAELTRIRQICCDPELCFEDYKSGSAKREALMDLISSLIDGGHRMLVFSQFTSMLSLIESDLQNEKIEYYKITGDTSKEKRMEMVRDFNEGQVPVFLISLKAGGTGLNLTGADTVIHYDPWWNTAAQDQATDRAHRIGQTRVVTVYKLILKNTIEEKILKMQEQKKKLADDILSGESISSSILNKDDLLALLDV